MKNSQDPKQIYSFYLGSFFLMDRDEMVEHYRSFKVTTEQETIWRNEIIETLTQQLPDTGILWKFTVLEACEAIPALIKYKDHGEGFFRCRLAETLFDILYSVTINKSNRATKADLMDAYKTTNIIWDDLKKNPNQKEIFNLSGEEVNNNYIIRRAKSNIARQSELLPVLEKYGFKG